MSVEAQLQLPSSPFPGIEPFHYADRMVFFEREREIRKLVDLVTIYRAILLYGASGTGKSSLVNAGLIPALLEEGFAPERVYVRPHVNAEFVIERIPVSDNPADGYLPSRFAEQGDDPESRRALSIEDFADALHPQPGEPSPLLIFDQFEEFITLFEIEPRGEALAEARQIQGKVLDLLIEIIQDQSRPVKLLFSFREDYLAQFDMLFSRRPELRDHFLHLTPIPADQLFDIIRQPFERFPGSFSHELSEELATNVTAEIVGRSENGDLNLSEAQIVCEMLWKDDDPEALFAQRRVQGLLEDYLATALARFPGASRDVAIAILSQLVTTAGTRNVVSAGDLVARIRDEANVSEAEIEESLRILETEAKLIRRELRHNVFYFEVVSEFLIPWIAEQRIELEAKKEEQKRTEESRESFARTRRRFTYAIGAILLTAAAVVLFILDRQSDRIRDEKTIVHAQSAAAQAEVQREQGQDEVAALLSTQALRFSNAADGAAMAAVDRGLRTALSLSDAPFVVPIDTFEGPSISSMDLDAARKLIAIGDVSGVVRVWVFGEATQPVREFTGNDASLRALAFNSEATSLITVSADGSVRLGDPLGDEDAFDEIGNVGEMTSAVFSSHGDTLATFERPGLSLGGPQDVKILVWRTDDLDSEPVGISVDEEPLQFAVSDDGRWLVTIQQQGGLRLWDLATSEQISLPMPAPANDEAAENGSGTPAASALPDARGDEIAVVQFSGDSRSLVAGQANGVVWMWTLTDRAGVPVRLNAGRALTALTVSDSGDRIVAFNDSGTVVTWLVGRHGSAMPAGTPVAALSSDSANPTVDVSAPQVAIHPTQRLLSPGAPVVFDDKATMMATVNCQIPADKRDQCRFELALWYVGDSSRSTTFGGSAVDLTGVSSDGKPGFVAAMGDSTIQQWSIGPQPELVATFSGSSSQRLSLVAATSTGNLVAATCASASPAAAAGEAPEFRLMTSQQLTRGCDNQITVWSGDTGEVSMTIDGSSCEGLRRLTVIEPDDVPLLAGGCSDGTIQIWNLSSGDPVDVDLSLEKTITALSSSADGRFLAAGDIAGQVRVWSVSREGEFEPQFSRFSSDGESTQESAPAIAAVAMSADGNLLAIADADREVLVWTLGNGNEEPRRSTAQSAVYSLAFNEEGSILAAGMNEVMAQWTVDELGTEEGNPKTIRQFESAFLALMFSDEGETVTGIPTNGVVFTWASTGSMKDIACERVTRDLTENEWNALIGSDEEYEESCSVPEAESS